MNQARAFWITAPGEGEIRATRLAPPGPGECRVRARYGAISRGTESLVFRGRVPPDQYAAMRAPLQEGEFPAPVKYGYISVGVVEGGTRAGERVFCLHPHQDRYNAPESMLVPIPDAVPDTRAVLAANMETAVNTVWDAGVGPGDRVAVIGAGVVGLLCAWLVRAIPGTRVALIDPEPARAEPARALGLALHAPAAARERPGPASCDVVIHCSGHGDGLVQALELAGTEARVVEGSWYGDGAVSLPLGEGFHSRRLELRSSQVGRIPPARAARWDHRRRLALALELLADPVLDVLISGEDVFEDLPRVMPRVAGPAAATTLCHRIRYPDPDPVWV